MPLDPCPPSRAAAPARAPPPDAAVSDVLGSVLLVGITVAMAFGLGLLLLAFDGPADTHHANLAASVDPGPDGLWGTGNEELRVRHLGGEALEARDTTIRYTVGLTSAAASGPSLGSAFADGRLTVGEAWTRQHRVLRDEPVTVQVVAEGGGGGGQLLTGASLVAGRAGTPNICVADVQPPFIVPGSVVQAPPDLTTAFSGAVRVRVTLADDCSGVDHQRVPQLLWRVSATPGTGGTGYSAVAMQKPAGAAADDGVWEALVPARTYSADVGRYLQYYVGNLADLHVPPNAGESARFSDRVDPQYKYAESATASPGSVLDLDNLKVPGEGAEARFAEAVVSGQAGSATLAATAVASGTGWTSAASAIGSDGIYASTADTNPTSLQLRIADPAATPGTLTQVVLRAEVNILGANNDGWQLQACLGASCTPASPRVTGTQADSLVAYDVTAVRPGGGSWTWTDVAALELRVVPAKQGSRDGTWQVDHAFVDVVYAPLHGMSVEASFGAVPSGASRTLELEYRVGGPSDRFDLQVATGCAPTCTWTTRATLSATAPTPLTYAFTPGEASAGFRVRFVSSAQDTVASQLLLDYLRVAVA